VSRQAVHSHKRRPSPDTVAAALAQLDVPWVIRTRKVSGAPLAKRPVALLVSLVEQDEARLRLAIIPLLLRHPAWASLVPEAVRRVSPHRRDVLKLYYTAAVILQQKYAARLAQFLGPLTPLTDWYSRELGIRVRGEPAARLRALARQHRARSGLALNWLGTYEHVAERFVRQLDVSKGRDESAHRR